MDRAGRVVGALDEMLPEGRVVDVGAGNGFTATALSRPGRRVIALEPAAGMIDRDAPLAWLRGDAAHLPFAPRSLDGIYATWAYFFPSGVEIESAVRDAERALSPSGVLAIANNLGDDEFTALSPRDIAEPVAPLRGARVLAPGRGDRLRVRVARGRPHVAGLLLRGSRPAGSTQVPGISRGNLPQAGALKGRRCDPRHLFLAR